MSEPPTDAKVWADLLGWGTRELSRAHVPNPAREARLIMANLLGVTSAEAIALDASGFDPDMADDYVDHVRIRADGKPLSRIRGWREFYGRRFHITPDVLDPRPETELLVEQGLKRLPPGGRVLDLGVGSGAIILSILAERPDVAGVGVDLSEMAMRVAERNSSDLGVDDRVEFRVGGWDTGEGPFDLILSNPPYIQDDDFDLLQLEVRDHDPAIALFGGPDGLDPYRSIAPSAFARLKPGGWLGVEHGAGQSDQVQAIMGQAGFTMIEALADLAGISRAVFGRRP